MIHLTGLKNPVIGVHRDLIVDLAARHRLPAVIHPHRFFVTSGGLIYYGCDQIVPWHGSAGYVDRILKGEKPSDLLVQALTKFELVINLKTANALDLTGRLATLATVVSDRRQQKTVCLQ